MKESEVAQQEASKYRKAFDMSPDNLTRDQTKILAKLVEFAVTDRFAKEFRYGYLGIGLCALNLHGMMYENVIDTVSESDILILEQEGFLYIKKTKGEIEWVAVKQKAIAAFSSEGQSPPRMVTSEN